ncbi:MAG: prolipoprotein diacylglyceryl transferase [Acidimicrobiia bacterium]|nr:prolipoprotein diacylglyceryl transferase [Acidimicrobiia bacterium]
MEFTLLGAVAVAVVTFGVTLWFEAGRTNPAGSSRRLGDAALAAALSGLLAGRLAAMVAGGNDPLAHPADIVVVRAGVDTGFAALAALAVLALYARHNLWRTLDCLAPAALAGLAAWHLSGLFRGAWLGTSSSLPWAVAQEGSTVTRHPVEVYAALGLLLGALALHLWKRRTPLPGIVGAAALVVASGVRLGTEPLRLGLGSGPDWWYAAGAALGMLLLGWRLTRPQSKPST